MRKWAVMNSRVLLSIALSAALGVVVACGGDDASDGADPGPATTFGADASSGGTSGTEGTSGSTGSSGRIGTSGSVGSSGSSGSSGADGGPDGSSSSGGGCSGAAADPAAAMTVSGYMDKLPSNAPTGATRAAIIDAVIKTCEAFGPQGAKAPGWDRKYCWAHLVSAMSKESGYNTTLTIKDSYGSRTTAAGKANDPTVGLLQIRFSSTVRDFVISGQASNLSCVGCTFPAAVTSHKGESGDSSFWAVTGPTANLSMMQSTACNVGLGAWYYYVFASGNGKPSAATYVPPYCSGMGTAGNLVTGLLSHLEGADRGKGVLDMNGVNALMTTDSNGYQYVTQIKAQVDSMVGPVAGTHPFFIKLSPNVPEYCK